MSKHEEVVSRIDPRTGKARDYIVKHLRPALSESSLTAIRKDDSTDAVDALYDEFGTHEETRDLYGNTVGTFNPTVTILNRPDVLDFPDDEPVL